MIATREREKVASTFTPTCGDTLENLFLMGHSARGPHGVGESGDDRCNSEDPQSGTRCIII